MICLGRTSDDPDHVGRCSSYGSPGPSSDPAPASGVKMDVQNEEGGSGEISSFAALCTALSATIGTGNIVGVATAVCTGGPGALFWMILAAFLEWQPNTQKDFWQ